MITHLVKVTNVEQDDWDERVDPVLFGYRVKVQSSTRFSPFELLYGIQARLPTELKGEEDETAEDVSPQDVQQRVEDLATRCAQQRKAGHENIGRAQAGQKERYDLKHQAPEFCEGDLVLKYNKRRDTRMGDKLAARYRGPFAIHEVLGKGVYRLRDGDTVLPQIANGALLKKFNVHIIPSTTPVKKVNTASTNVSPTTSANSPTPKIAIDPPSTPLRHPKSPKDKNVSPATAPTPPLVPAWIPSLSLNQEDRRLLQAGEWLNDKLVDACNTLVARHIGLDNNQTTLLVQDPNGFQPANGDVVQILHDVDHWVACASVDGKVYLADSANRPISAVVGKQIKQLFPRNVTPNGKIAVYRIPSDKQPNGADCGVYAAAFTFQWATGTVACDVGFTNSVMRTHLETCLYSQEVVRFPCSVMKKRGRKRQTIRQLVD